MNSIAANPFTKPVQNEIHVWIASHRNLSPELLAPLSTDEIERAERFISVPAREAFVSTRSFLRTVLGNYLSMDPRDVTFRYDENGKPSVAPRHVIYFNVSHTNDLAALAFSTMGPVGIDIEKLNHVSDADEIANRYFSPAEAVRVKHSTTLKSQTFLQLWVRKEAQLKCSGVGLSELGPATRFVGCVEEFQPARDHVGAIAVFESHINLCVFNGTQLLAAPCSTMT